jgi:hypothetical protein
MDDDIAEIFERLAKPEAAALEECERIHLAGISCCGAGLVCERCGHGSLQHERLLAASVLPRFR